MENNNRTEQPKTRKVNDFIKMIIGIVLLIAALLALKYLMAAIGAV